MKNKKMIISVVAIIAVIAVMIGISVANKPATSKGAKAVTLEVVDDAGSMTTYNANTDAEYLSGLFEEIEGLTVEGEVGEYGFTIFTVNGLTADFNTSSAYWAIYVNGEYGMYGADSQPVGDGDVFTLAYETY